MAEEKGIKETVELFAAMKDVAVIVFKAKKAAGANVAALPQAIAAELMTNPQAINDLKAAADNIQEVPAELKDLSMGEIFQLVAECGKLATEASAAIKE